MVDRVVEMADACAKHIRNIAAGQGDPAAHAAAAGFTRDSILRGIHYFRVQNATEQRAVIESLPAFVAERAGKVKLVVVDSVAFHFRQDFEDMHLRTRILGAMNCAPRPVAGYFCFSPSARACPCSSMGRALERRALPPLA